MTLGRLGGFFGDDWDDTLDSIKSVPGAFGNILMVSFKQVRLFDIGALTLVFVGWLWLLASWITGHDMRSGVVVLALLPTFGWLIAGSTGAVIFEFGGLGARVFRYWESYVLIAFFSIFGTISLRLALNPKDRIVYRNPDRSSSS